MKIKSFRERAEELEREEFPLVSLNGIYACEFEEWLRENRNKPYDYSMSDTHLDFISHIEISLNKTDMDIKDLSFFTQISKNIIINSLSSEYMQSYKSVFFNELGNYSYEVKSGEDLAA